MIHRVPLLLALIVLLAATAHADPWDHGMAAYKAGAYAEAVAAWTQVERADAPPVRRGEVQAWLGLALLKLERLPAADRWLEQAASDDDLRVRAMAERVRGRLAQRRDDLDEAAERYAAARLLAGRDGDPQQLLITHLYAADIALQRGAPLEAHEAYADALEVALELGDRHREAIALAGIGLVCQRLKQLDLARAYLDQSAALALELGLSTDAAYALIQGAFTRELAGDYDEAEALLDQAEPLVGDYLLRRRTIELRRAFLDLRRGRTKAARARADALAAAQAEHAVAYIEPAIALFEARLALAEGRGADARRAIDRASATANDEMRRLEVDFLAAQVALGEGDEDEAVAALRRFVRRHDAFREGFADVRLRDYLGHEYAAGLRRLLETKTVSADAALASWVIARLKGRLFADRLLAQAAAESGADGRADRARRLDAAVRGFWRHSTEAPEAPTDAVVLDYYLGEHRLWIVWRAGAQQGVETAPVGRARITADAKALLNAIRGRRPDWRAAAEPLADHLLGPLRRARAQQPRLDRLVVVPNGPLHSVPFEALPLDADHLVVEAFTVTYAANAATAPLEPLPAPPRAGTSLWVADARGDLPGARAEVRALSARAARPTVLTGAAATRSDVLKAMGAADLIHLAVHGRPADGDGPPRLLLAAGQRLTAADLLQHRLAGAAVILAACDSAVGQPDTGDEMPTVLPRALLLAGARSVIGTRWPIDDRSASELMTQLHARLRREGPERALAEAQRSLLRSAAGDTVIALRNGPACDTNRGLRECTPSARVGLAHPFHWAGFALLGAATTTD